MNLNSLGEFGWVEIISQNSRVPEGVTGIGDDAAVVLPSMEQDSTTISTDMLVEGRHFRLHQISPFDLGYKSVAVNLSDLAAMGSKPTHLLLSIAMPGSTTEKWLREFADGFKACASKYGATLIGGDTVSTDGPIVINVTAMGQAPAKKIKLRSTAKFNDIIAVTSTLGDSAAGLLALNEKLDQPALITRHLRPEPHVSEGLFLAGKTSVHAMMDVSDGIGSDLQRLTNQSKCGASIELEKIPLSAEFQKARGFDFELAVNGGEDYCLLACIDPRDFTNIAKEFQEKFGRPLFPIGTITERTSIEFTLSGKHYDFKTKPWSHF